MKTLGQYLAESATEHEFRLKTIVELSDKQLDKLETHLRKYDAFDIGALKRTILQSAPLDFYNAGAKEVFIMDFKTRLPMSPAILVNELVQKLGVAERDIRVRNKLEPGEILDAQSMEEVEAEEVEAKLLDSEYSDHENAKHEDGFGEEHKTKFLDELDKTRVEHNTEYKGTE